MVIKTKSVKETQKIARLFVRDIKNKKQKRPLILALEGELGSGKTTFVQGFTRALGVREKVVSSTFVLLKIYSLPPAISFKYLVHIDCYRLDSSQDLIHLGFKDLLKDKDAILIIEWADRIKALLPKNSWRIKFSHGKIIQERIIQFLKCCS